MWFLVGTALLASASGHIACVHPHQTEPKPGISVRNPQPAVTQEAAQNRFQQRSYAEVSTTKRLHFETCSTFTAQSVYF